MIDIGRGVIAGAIASAAVAGAVFLTASAGLVPDADPVRTLSGIVLSPAGLSWVVHFAVGAVVWGALFAILSPILPRPSWLKGVIFGAVAWLVMLLIVWADDPASVPRLDPIPAVLHILFGIILGAIYATLAPPARIAEDW